MRLSPRVLPLVLLASLGLAAGSSGQQKPILKNDPGARAPAPSGPAALPPAAPASPGAAAPAAGGPTMTFGGVPYFHRWSKGVQHELTPQGQEDLQKWSDLLTVVYYRQAQSDAALAAAAKALVEAYRQNKGTILKAETVPAAGGRPTEHFVTVTFNRPGASEVTYARLSLRDGMGVAVLYGHRTYGASAGVALAEWLRLNGIRANQSLRALEPIPPLTSWPQQ